MAYFVPLPEIVMSLCHEIAVSGTSTTFAMKTRRLPQLQYTPLDIAAQIQDTITVSRY